MRLDFWDFFCLLTYGLVTRPATPVRIATATAGRSRGGVSPGTSLL